MTNTSIEKSVEFTQCSNDVNTLESKPSSQSTSELKYQASKHVSDLAPELDCSKKVEGASYKKIMQQQQQPRGRDRYVSLDNLLGEGTYGRVETARDKVTGSIVAIKKVKVTVGNDSQNKSRTFKQTVGNCGLHFTTVREIKVMREVLHPNLIGVLDVYVQGDFVNLVMEVMETDLKKIIDRRVRLTEAHIKCIMRQVLRGLEKLHAFFFVHRDLSPANIFVNSGGICKVADFGLSRAFGWQMTGTLIRRRHQGEKDSRTRESMTSRVVTLWYRPPELVFGAGRYGYAIDMWSVGCIFAELLTGKPLFPGTNEIDQLGKIFEACGTPSDNNWAEAKHLPFYAPFTKKAPKKWEQVFQGHSQEALNLMKELLQLDPRKRISAATALKHPYFSTIPLPCRPHELPIEFAH